MGPNEEFFNFYGNDVIKNGLELLKERKIKKIFAHNLMFDGLVIIRNLPNG